jgi:protein SCO1
VLSTRLVPLVLAMSLAAACREAAQAPAASRYPVKGTVVEVDGPARSVTLAHQEIAGFMPAMTMPFAVGEAEAALLRVMAPGDSVTATLVVSSSRYWLESVVVVKPESPAAVPAGAKATRPPQPGAAMPDVALVDQDGRPLRTSSYRGRALALTFVFTRCPMPEFCPFLMRGFAGAHALLVADPALAERTALLSVSFDVAHDTPKVLVAYGRPFQKTEPPFSHWRLATGRLDEVRRLAAAFGLEFSEEQGSFNHNLRTAVVGPDGRLRRLLTGNDWTAAELVAELRAALDS